MRSVYFKATVLGLALLAMAGELSRTAAQTTNRLRLVSLDQEWKYCTLTNLSYGPTPTPWYATNYNDSWWTNGLPAFGSDPDLPSWYFQTFIPGPSGGGPITAYFRTTFNYNSNLSGVTLLSSNLIDDGLVVYLNGQEIYRINMTNTAISNASLALGAATEGAWQLRYTITSMLKKGTNLLAAELHQNSATSSDDVFALGLDALIGPLDTALTIRTQPKNVVVECEGLDAFFSVTTTGANPHYRWYWNQRKGGTLWYPFGDDSPTVNLADDNGLRTFNDGASVFVLVTNSLTVLTSKVVTLSVFPDTCGPRIKSAVVDSTNNTAVIVTFDENVYIVGATNPANYSVTLFGQNTTIPLTSSNKPVDFPFGDDPLTRNATVRLNMATNLYYTNGYVLTVNGVRDVKVVPGNPPNFIAPNTQVAIEVNWVQELFPMTQSWLWNENGTNPPPNWTAANFNPPPEDLWAGPAPGILYFSNEGSLPTPCPDATYNAVSHPSISFYNIAYYFRTLFMCPSNRPATLSLQHWIDDGAVFFLNGKELTRYNMPAGFIDSGTVAAANIDASCMYTNLYVTNLLSGTNCMAVEVHQNSPDSFDLDFGVAASVSVPYAPNFNVIPFLYRPRLYTAKQGTNMVISWTNYPASTRYQNGFRLQYTTNLVVPDAGGAFPTNGLGPWFEAQPMSNPYTNITSQKRIYRLFR